MQEHTQQTFWLWDVVKWKIKTSDTIKPRSIVSVGFECESNLKYLFRNQIDNNIRADLTVAI